MIDNAYKKIVDLHKSGFEYLNKVEINDGDRYYNENGIDYIIDIPDIQFNLSIGYAYITEDDDDWAQAECYEVKWNRFNGDNISDEKAVELIESLIKIIREQKLNLIL